MKHKIEHPPQIDDDTPFIQVKLRDLNSAEAICCGLIRYETEIDSGMLDGTLGDGQYTYFCVMWDVGGPRIGSKPIPRPVWFRAEEVYSHGSRWEPGSYDIRTIPDGFDTLWEAVAETLVEEYRRSIAIKADNHCYHCDGCTEDVDGPIDCPCCKGRGWIELEGSFDE